MDQELLKLVRDLKLDGKSDQEIRAVLASQWPADKIDSCLAALSYMNSDLNVSQQPPVNNTSNSFQAATATETNFLSAFKTYVIGLIVITFFALILGLIFGGTLISHSREYFGNFKDLPGTFISIPIVTMLFLVVAQTTKVWAYVAIPILAFNFGQDIFQSSTVSLLAGYTPVTSSGDKLKYVIAVTLTYAALYAILVPAYKIIQNLVSKDTDNSLSAIRPQAIMLVLSVAGIFVIGLVSHPLYINQQRTRNYVHIPLTPKISARWDSVITYRQNINGKNYTTGSDGFTVSPVQKWWKNSSREACGTSIAYGGADTAEPLVYEQTKSGIQYGNAVFTLHTSKNPMPTNSYKVYKYCFAIGYQKYVIERMDFGTGPASLKYPIDNVIDTIVGAKTFLPVCQQYSMLVFCKESDTQKLNTVDTFSSQYNYPNYDTGGNKADGVSHPQVNTSAYKAAAQLNISEWGVKISLPEEIKNATYSAQNISTHTTYGWNQSLPLSLKSLPANECQGIATVERYKLADAQASHAKDPNITIEGIVAGDYVYELYISDSKFSQCSQVSGYDQSKMDTIKDEFVWASANIKNL